MPAAAWELLFERVPRPRLALDSVSELLWDRDLSELGLPFVVRCLATWSRVQRSNDVPEAGAQVLAAAISAMVGRRSGRAQTRVAAADTFGAEAGALVAAGRSLQRVLANGPGHPW